MHQYPLFSVTTNHFPSLPIVLCHCYPLYITTHCSLSSLSTLHHYLLFSVITIYFTSPPIVLSHYYLLYITNHCSLSSLFTTHHLLLFSVITVHFTSPSFHVLYMEITLFVALGLRCSSSTTNSVISTHSLPYCGGFLIGLCNVMDYVMAWTM